jgi:hypothetical protein
VLRLQGCTLRFTTPRFRMIKSSLGTAVTPYPTAAKSFSTANLPCAHHKLSFAGHHCMGMPIVCASESSLGHGKRNTPQPRARTWIVRATAAHAVRCCCHCSLPLAWMCW